MEGQISIKDYLEKAAKENQKFYLHETGNQTHGVFPTNEEWRPAKIWIRIYDTGQTIVAPGLVKDYTFKIDSGYIPQGSIYQITAWQYTD